MGTPMIQTDLSEEGKIKGDEWEDTTDPDEANHQLGS
jgi:hypothetical protein